jgi:hypothetical protein
MGDDWRLNLAAKLLGDGGAERANSFAATGTTALEIAFGQARSEATYVLELARAHGVPATGNVIGDEVWVRLGTSTARFTMDRGERRIRASSPGRSEAAIVWDEGKRHLALDGEAVDMQRFVRDAIDAMVSAFKSTPPPAVSSTSREIPAVRKAPPKDESTK